MGSEGKRKIRLRRKTNTELFLLYEDHLSLRYRSKDALDEAKRVLVHFRDFLGDSPPAPELAISYLSRFAKHKPTTLYRYNSIIKTFMDWYGEKLDTKIRIPETLPDYVELDDIEKLKKAMKSKKLTRNLLKETYLLLNSELKLD